MARLRVLAVSALLISVSCLANGQDDEPTDPIVWFHTNQEVRIANLPSLTAASTDSSAVLATELETVLQDQAVCCGKYSALGDAVLSEPRSLKELSAKLQGRHLLSDGLPIGVSAEYVPQDAIFIPALIVGALRDKHACLVEWKSHFYVLYGAIVNETAYYSGRRQYVILKLLLLDPRFSDQRREVVFNRETDDWGKEVQGLLALTVMRQ